MAFIAVVFTSIVAGALSELRFQNIHMKNSIFSFGNTVVQVKKSGKTNPLKE